MSHGMVAILITKTDDYGVDEYRVAHLPEPDMFIERDLTIPQVQAMFVLKFAKSEIFTESADAITKAGAIAKFYKLDMKSGVGFLNYDHEDWKSFMDYSFADRLVNGKKKANARRKH